MENSLYTILIQFLFRLGDTKIKNGFKFISNVRSLSCITKYIFIFSFPFQITQLFILSSFLRIDIGIVFTFF